MESEDPREVPRPDRSGRSLLAAGGALALVALGVLLWPSFGGPRDASGSAWPYRLRIVPPPHLEAEVAFLEERIRRRPDDGLDLASLASVHVRVARLTGDPGGYDRAEEAARRSLRNLPGSNPGAKLALAQVAQARLDFPEALRLAGEVRRENPANPQALSVLVTASLGVGDLDSAEREADALVARLPTLEAYSLRGLARLARGKEREAEQDFEAGIAREETGEVEESARARALLGRLHFNRGRHELARGLYEEALRILPGSLLALSHRAELDARCGDLEAAERRCAQAFRLSGEPAFLAAEARLKARAGDAAAAEDLRRAAESRLRRAIAGGASGCRGELSRLLLDRGRPGDLAEAVALAEAEACARRDAQTLDTLAWALSRAGRLDEARRAIGAALDTGVLDASLCLRAGEIDGALGHTGRAARLLDRALEIDPTCAEARDARRRLSAEAVPELR